MEQISVKVISVLKLRRFEQFMWTSIIYLVTTLLITDKISKELRNIVDG